MLDAVGSGHGLRSWVRELIAFRDGLPQGRRPGLSPLTPVAWAPCVMRKRDDEDFRPALHDDYVERKAFEDEALDAACVCRRRNWQ